MSRSRALRVCGVLGLALACSDDTAGTGETGTETGDSQAPLDPCDPGPSSVERPELDWRVDYDQPGSEIINDLALRPGGGVVGVGQAMGSVLALELDASGEELWRVGPFAGIQSNAVRVVLDDQGNSYIAGTVVGALEGQEAGGESDLFMAALGPAGELLWVRQWGSPGDEFTSDMTMGAPGQLLVTGNTDAAFAGEHLGSRDGYVVEVDTQGELQWQLQWGTPEFDWPRAIAANCEGEFVVAGSRYDIQGIPGAFVERFDSSGEQLWSRGIQGPANQIFADVALLDDVVYAVGSVTEMDDFNNSSAGLAAAYSTAGSKLWDQEVGVTTLNKIISAGDGLIIGKDEARLERLETDGSWGWTYTVQPTANLSAITSVERAPDGSLYVASLDAKAADRNAMIARLLPAAP